MNAQPPDEEAIIHAARRIESPGARAAYLDQACGGDRVLRSRLDELLHALDHEPRFLESSPVPPGGAPGAVIGSYRPLRTIGEGGMGVVYLAEQEHPVRRRVALKVIKPGLDTAQVVARFEAERQALALMDHPNIARVLDAGAIADGRPYFVMELVRGIPITAYCDEHRLSVRERLELFIPVCQAIAHAHGAGVIHRDITPSNVLVTLVDDRPVPKVIDFGVAKAISQRLTEQIFLTQFGTIVGTLEYMSPEQAAAGSREPDVDPRSDVYSLGVLLYELLTGGTPLRRATLAQAPIDEILRRIREEVPPEPSRRVRQAAETRATIAARRRSEPAELIGQLRGPVDRIVMKALAKDRARRYDTARELARAIEHFLDPESREVGAPGATPRRASAAKNLAIAWAVTVGVLIGVAVLIPVLLAGGGRPARIGPAQESAPTARRPGPTNPEVAEAAPDTKTAEGDRGSARRPEAREGITPRPPSPGPPPTAPELDEDRRIAAIEAFGGHVSRNPYLTVDLSGAGPRLTDDALAHLSASLESLGSVHTLNLSRTGVTDAGLVHLKGLDRLAVLFLVGTRIHGPGLEHLQGLNRLRRLELGSTPVTDEFLVPLSALQRLEYLSLRNTKITGRGLVHLRALDRLSTLFLYHTKVDDAALESLAGMYHLGELNLGTTQVTDAGLAHLARQTQLQHLNLNGTNVTDAGLTTLRGLTRLKRLDLGGTRITDEGLVKLAALTRLETLDLTSTRVTGSEIAALQARLPNLKNIIGKR